MPACETTAADTGVAAAVAVVAVPASCASDASSASTHCRRAPKSARLPHTAAHPAVESSREEEGRRSRQRSLESAARTRPSSITQLLPVLPLLPSLLLLVLVLLMLLPWGGCGVGNVGVAWARRRQWSHQLRERASERAQVVRACVRTCGVCVWARARARARVRVSEPSSALSLTRHTAIPTTGTMPTQ